MSKVTWAATWAAYKAGARQVRSSGDGGRWRGRSRRAMGLPALLASALCTFVLPLLLFLAAIKLWDLYCVSSRDRSCALPLPPGTMGFPFFGETLQMVLQVREIGAGQDDSPEPRSPRARLGSRLPLKPG